NPVPEVVPPMNQDVNPVPEVVPSMNQDVNPVPEVVSPVNQAISNPLGNQEVVSIPIQNVEPEVAPIINPTVGESANTEVSIQSSVDPQNIDQSNNGI
ncbi:MAG: hypothetical protein K2M17_04295, partial [Bacilli bacterium]|nr:hypothetical protein [Bacilli bacterium]